MFIWSIYTIQLEFQILDYVYCVYISVSLVTLSTLYIHVAFESI